MSSDSIRKQELDRHRRMGSRGTIIEMHHSLRHINLSAVSILSIFLLPLVFDVVLWHYLENITGLWANIFNFWSEHLGIAGKVFYTEIYLPGGRMIYMPFPNLEAAVPSAFTVWANLVICLIIYLVSVFIPKKFLPIIYFIRALVLIQISASVYFLLNPGYFPYDMGDYISGTMALGIYLLLLIPPVMAMIYYIFDFGIVKKFLVTFAMLLYFMILIPFQYMMHAIIISAWGLLFMPVLYLNFGLILDTLMFIGWYSWAMTGKRKTPRIA